MSAARRFTYSHGFGTEFTEQDIIRPFEEAMADPKVRQAAVANNDEENFGVVFDRVFEDKMMDHVDSIASFGREYFGPNPDFKATLNSRARRAAWNLIRRQAGIADDAA